jgi:hypothetical protein
MVEKIKYLLMVAGVFYFIEKLLIALANNS